MTVELFWRRKANIRPCALKVIVMNERAAFTETALQNFKKESKEYEAFRAHLSSFD